MGKGLVIVCVVSAAAAVLVFLSLLADRLLLVDARLKQRRKELQREAERLAEMEESVIQAEPIESIEGGNVTVVGEANAA